MITNTMDDLALPIYGDGMNSQRDWIHVEDQLRAPCWPCSKRGTTARSTTSAASDIDENHYNCTTRLLRLIGKPETLPAYVGSPGPRSPLRPELRQERRTRIRLETADHPFDEGFRQTIEWNTAKHLYGWRRSRRRLYVYYYQKYYENRDSSLHAIADSGRGNRR